MADIGNEIDAIRAAVIGEQVREDIAVALEKMNEQAAAAQEWATGQDDPTAEPGPENNAAHYAAQAADSMSRKIDIPRINDTPSWGTQGQLLMTNGANAAAWTNAGTPSDAQVGEAVGEWLDAHPEATTTVDFQIVNKVFSTKSGMISDLSLEVGDYAKTNGFYVEGDGGQAYYKILATGSPNGKDIFEINTTPKLYAHLIENGNYFDPMQYGAHGDGETDDSEFVQYALDKAIAADGALVVTRRHVVKNIAINKTAELRKPTYIVGLGGSFVSDHGTMFACGNQSVSDVFFENVSFEGDTDSIAVNCYRLYRMHFVNCQFDGLKKGLYVDGLMQSYIIDGCVFTHISDKCIETKTNYQVKVSNCIAEVSPNARFFEANGYSNNLTIRDCCIEGFTNIIPIYLSGSGAVSITSNYFEANMLGDIEFNSLTNELYAVSIYNNQNLGVVNDSIAMIKWAGHILRACSSYGNDSAGIPINDMQLVSVNNNFISVYNNRTASSAGVNINAKYINDPFRGVQSLTGNNSFQTVNKYHRRFEAEINGTGDVELFSVISPYANKGFWNATLKLSGILGGIGSFSAEYRILQDGTSTPIFQTRDISSKIVVDSSGSAGSQGTVTFKLPSLSSSLFAEIEVYGYVASITFDGTTFRGVQS